MRTISTVSNSNRFHLIFGSTYASQLTHNRCARTFPFSYPADTMQWKKRSFTQEGSSSLSPLLRECNNDGLNESEEGKELMMMMVLLLGRMPERTKRRKKERKKYSSSVRKPLLYSLAATDWLAWFSMHKWRFFVSREGKKVLRSLGLRSGGWWIIEK